MLLYDIGPKLIVAAALAQQWAAISVGRGEVEAGGRAPETPLSPFTLTTAYSLSDIATYALSREAHSSVHAWCMPSLIFQADCGSIKGAEVPVEVGTEHYLSW